MEDFLEIGKSYRSQTTMRADDALDPEIHKSTEKMMTKGEAKNHQTVIEKVSGVIIKP